MLFVYIISYISFSLLTFVVACYASVLDTPGSLNDKIVLENINENKLKALLQRLGMEKPKWLNIPDHERVLWVNKIIKQLWPHMGAYIEDVIENMIDDLKFKLKIESLFHGNEAPKISSVTVREKPDNKTFLDVNLIYGGDFSGCVKYGGLEFEIIYVKIEAAVQIELSNFVGYVPFVGKIVVHMEKPPTITPTLKKVAAIFENRFVFGQIENAIKKYFPLSRVLVPDAVEDLQESPSLSPGTRIRRDRGVEKDASSVKIKSNTQWGLIAPTVKENAKKAQIITYLQETKNPRNRLSDPGVVGKQMLESMDTLSLGQTLNLQRSFIKCSTNPAANISSETNNSKWIENTRSGFPSPSNQASIPGISSTSLASASLNKADVSTQPLNTKIVSDLHSVNKRDDELLDSSTADIYPDSPERTESPVSTTLLPEVDLESSRTWQYASRTGSLVVSSTVERTSTESSPGKWEGGLRAVIAKDVESARIIVPEKDSTDSVDSESIVSEDRIGPFTLVSSKGLSGIMAANSSHGCVELTTTFKAPDTLVVIVHRARNLPKKGGRKPNPYVKLHLLNEELKELREESTPVFDSITDPEYESTIAFPLSKPLSECILRVSVKTKHKLPHHLGQVLLRFVPYVTHQKMKERNWYDLADPKKDYVMCWVGYRDSTRFMERDQVDSYDGVSVKSEEFREQLM